MADDDKQNNAENVHSEQNVHSDEQNQQTNESSKTHGITVGMKPKLPALHKRISKSDFVQCIEQNCGITTAICNKLDCSYAQYWYAVKKWHLEEFVKEQRNQLVSIAENVMSELLNSKDERIRFQTANYILKTQGANQGWSEPKNITQIDATNGTVSIKQIFGIEE